MFTMILIGIVLAIGSGFLMKAVADRVAAYSNVNLHELVVGSIVCAVLVVPLVTSIGFAVAKSSAMKYYEFYNGFESSATISQNTCSRDGSCHYTYNCDPYRVMVTTYSTDSKGHTHPHRHWETRYHHCPYATEEFTYYVSDTLGDTHQIGDVRFADNPQPWRGDMGLPSVETGKPAFWVAAKTRIDAKNPGGVTKQAAYDNYIMASQHDIYAKHSSDIDTYTKAGLMPGPAGEVIGFYDATKFQAVKVAVPRPGEWDEAIARFNGKLGGTRRGDLHMVVVDAAKVTDPDRYALAMESYWQSPTFGKHTLSKNGIVVIIGAADGKVTWARGFTGMPEGNELVLQKFHNLAGTPMTPAAIFGPSGVGQAAFAATTSITTPAPATQTTPEAQSPALPIPAQTTTTPAPAPAVTEGALEKIIFDKDGGYQRVHMASYAYLKDDIQPSGWQKFWVGTIGLVVSLLIWALMLMVDFTVPLPAAFTATSNDPKPDKPRTPRGQHRDPINDLIAKYRS